MHFCSLLYLPYKGVLYQLHYNLPMIAKYIKSSKYCLSFLDRKPPSDSSIYKSPESLQDSREEVRRDSLEPRFHQHPQCLWDNMASKTFLSIDVIQSFPSLLTEFSISRKSSTKWYYVEKYTENLSYSASFIGSSSHLQKQFLGGHKKVLYYTSLA